MPSETSITVSVSRKVNLERVLGPQYKYESVDIFVALSGLPVDVTDADIQAALETGERIYAHIKRDINTKVAQIRREEGNGRS